MDRRVDQALASKKNLVVGAGLKERWSDYLPLAVRILNATRTAGIGCAPAEIVFGGRVHLNRELLEPFACPTGAGGQDHDHTSLRQDSSL